MHPTAVVTGIAKHLDISPVAVSINLPYQKVVYHPDDLDEGRGVAQIPVMQMEVGLSFQVSNSLTEVNAAAPDDAVHIVAFFEQELGEIAAILTGNAGNQCFFIVNLHFFVWLCTKQVTV